MGDSKTVRIYSYNCDKCTDDYDGRACYIQGRGLFLCKNCQKRLGVSESEMEVVKNETV